MRTQNGNDSGYRQGEKGAASCRVFAPQCDIYERDDAYVVLADLPGTDEKDIDIKIEKNILSIQASCGCNADESTMRMREYLAGDYKRELQLSDSIDSEKVDASMKNGVLKIVLPKSEQHKPRRIEVRIN